MKLRWTRPALADLHEAQQYIAQHNVSAAQEIAQRVWNAVQELREHPRLGREGHVAGTRELVVSRTPYLVVYRLHNDTVEILRLWHARRNWQAETLS